MTSGSIHTIHRNGYSVNEIEWGGVLMGRFASKEAATAVGGAHAKQRNVIHVVHSRAETGAASEGPLRPAA